MARCREPACDALASLSWMRLMADPNATNDIPDERPSALPTARTFPDGVPILIDAEAGIKLRALADTISHRSWSSAEIRR
jgi:hypothetical protein